MSLLCIALALGALLLVAVLVRRADRYARREIARFDGISSERIGRIRRGALVTDHRFKLGEHRRQQGAKT